MTTMTAVAPARSFSIPTHWRARSGYIVLLAVLAYLVVLPMVRLQILAFEDGAAGYKSQYGRYDIAKTLGTTAALAVGSLVIAMVLGTLLAYAASRLPSRLGWLKMIPILPIVMPAVASIVGWAFLLSPGPGYLNVLLRKLRGGAVSNPGPWTSTQCRGSLFSPVSGSRPSCTCSSAPGCRTSVPNTSRPRR